MKPNYQFFLRAFFQILPLRVFIVIVLIVVLGSLVFGFFTLHQFKTGATLILKQQGILLARALESGIFSDLRQLNVQGLQESINRFVSAQENDIEVNIILLKGEKSHIVASNIADNIEETSPEEHQDLLKALKSGQPIFLISKGEEENDDAARDREENDERQTRQTDAFNFSDDRPFMSISTAFLSKEVTPGCINVKLSLEPLERKLTGIYQKLWAAAFFEIVLILAGFVGLFNYFIKVKIRSQQEEAVRLKSEIKALQSQVNPHFLFNTLSALTHLITADPPMAEKLTLNMATLFRSILGAGKREWWSVEEEMKIIKTYLEIETIRLGNKLKYTLNVSKNVLDIRIPSLLIQPLVENSIKHGVTASAAGGEIKVTIFFDKELVFLVEDKRYPSDYPAAPNPVGEKTGIENIKKRLDLIYANKAWFIFKILDDGAVAKITIQEDPDRPSHV